MRVRDEKNTEALKQELLARLASCEKRQQEAAEKARTIVVEDEVKIVQPHPEKEPLLEKIRLYEEKKEEQRRKEDPAACGREGKTAAAAQCGANNHRSARRKTAVAGKDSAVRTAESGAGKIKIIENLNTRSVARFATGLLAVWRET